MKLFTDLLREHRKGIAAEEATFIYRELVRKIRETGKGGSMTLTLKMSPSNGDVDQIEIDISVSAKPPQRSIPKAIFYSDEEGDLFRTDPKQNEAFTEAEMGDRVNRRRSASL